jgi:hypothetical protein
VPGELVAVAVASLACAAKCGRDDEREVTVSVVSNRLDLSNIFSPEGTSRLDLNRLKPSYFGVAYKFESGCRAHVKS